MNVWNRMANPVWQSAANSRLRKSKSGRREMTLGTGWGWQGDRRAAREMESDMTRRARAAVARQRSQLEIMKHLRHDVDIRPGTGPHAGQLYCLHCDSHIQWLSQSDYDYLKGHSR